MGHKLAYIVINIAARDERALAGRDEFIGMGKKASRKGEGIDFVSRVAEGDATGVFDVISTATRFRDRDKNGVEEGAGEGVCVDSGVDGSEKDGPKVGPEGCPEFSGYTVRPAGNARAGFMKGSREFIKGKREVEGSGISIRETGHTGRGDVRLQAGILSSGTNIGVYSA